MDSRVLTRTAGVAYLAHPDPADDRFGTDLVLIVRLLAGATADAAARDRLAGLVNKLHIDTVLARGGQGQDEGRWARRFLAEETPVAGDTAPEAAWVALAWNGSPRDVALAETLLAEVELRTVAQQGSPAGPAYRHYWTSKVRPGLAHLWPLPWPGRHERAGWRSLLVSWLLMLLLAAIAVLIAILIFKDQPPIQPPPPKEPTSSPTGSPPPESGSPPPDSASPSPQSGSPTPSDSASPDGNSASPSPGSPSPSDSGSATPGETGSPSPSGSESGPGQPSPRSRL